MDSTFWIGLFAGGFISLAASIVANIYNAKIAEILQSRKLLTLEKQRTKAEKLDRLISDLHSGRRDKYLFAVHVVVGAHTFFLMFFVLAVAVITILAMDIDVNIFSFSWESLLARENRAVVLRNFTSLVIFAMMMLCAFIGIRTRRRYFQVFRALDDFDAYRAAFAKKWRDSLGN